MSTPHRHTKIVEIRHTVFLEDNKIRESKVAREISLEEKWIFVPALMDEKTFSTLPVDVVAAPTVQATAMPTPIVSSLVAIMNELEEPVL